MTIKITAKQDTWLKKPVNGKILQSSDTPENLKVFVPKGKSYQLEAWEENALQSDPADHLKVVLDYGAGTWYVYHSHFDLPWQQVVIPEEKETLPEWNEVNWNDFSSKVSKYFTVGEVALYQRQRIPTDVSNKKNVIRIARKMDEIREWWGSAILVNSWYRPWSVERRIGGSGANHPYGHSIDFKPAKGSVWDMQSKFESEWYNAGRWKGGFGRGANKGFIHLDLRHKRKWNY